jgi:hypothetical protein
MLRSKHFLTLNIIPQSSANCWRFLRFCWRISLSLMELIALYNRMSSANRRIWGLTLSLSGRPLMWQRNSSRPNTVPCGTHDAIGTCRDFSPLRTFHAVGGSWLSIQVLGPGYHSSLVQEEQFICYGVECFAEVQNNCVDLFLVIVIE